MEKILKYSQFSDPTSDAIKNFDQYKHSLEKRLTFKFNSQFYKTAKDNLQECYQSIKTKKISPETLVLLAITFSVIKYLEENGNPTGQDKLPNGELSKITKADTDNLLAELRLSGIGDDQVRAILSTKQKSTKEEIHDAKTRVRGNKINEQ